MTRGKEIRRGVSMVVIATLITTPNATMAGAIGSLWASSDMPIRTAPLWDTEPDAARQDVELVLPIRERGPLGQASVIIDADNRVRVRATELVALLTPLVTPEASQALAQTADPEGYISQDAAASVGFGLVFDPGLLDVAVTLPLEARQRQSLTLGFDTSVVEPPVTDLSRPFAAYLNYRMSVDYLHRDLGNREAGLQAPRWDLDFNGTVGPVAFENQFTVDPDSTEEFQRAGSRLIYDQPDRALRWTVGDLIPEGTSFQSASDIAGLSVARLYGLRPNGRLITARSSRSVTLRETSNVEIRVNGVVTRTLILEAGTYDLRDLPLTQGANAVEIVVEGPSGSREVIAFDFFSDTTLLAPGVDEFYVSTGVRAPRDGGSIDYQGEPIFSAFYRRGLTEQISAGANLQATSDAFLAGGQVVYGGALGLTAFDLAASHRDGVGSGYALRVEHRLARDVGDLPGQETIDLSAEVRSEDFGDIETLRQANNYSVIAAARYSRPLSRALIASIGADYGLGRGSVEDRYGLSAFASWRVDYETNVNFGATYSSNALAGEETNVFVNLTRRFGARRTFSAGAESRNGLVRAGFSQTPERAIDDWGFSADVTRTDEAYGFNGTAIYRANRAELEVSHDTLFNQDGDVANQQTSLRAYGSLAYAGGRLVAGREIFDSFALVRPHSSLGGRPVLIRGAFSLEESARSGLLGPAVVPLGSYYPQSVPYDVEDLPLGYDLGAGLFQLKPRLHSGYLLTVGSDYYVTASGLMVDSRGMPVSLRVGRAVSLDDPNAPQVDVLTNRTGRFAISGLAAGRWRITLLGEPPLTYDIVVPEATLFRAGTIRPSGSGE